MVLVRLSTATQGYEALVIINCQRNMKLHLVLEGQTKFRQSYKTLEEVAVARKEAEEQWFKPLIEKWYYNEGKS